MKKLLMIILPLIICGFTFMKGENIFPYKIHQHKLPNGLNVVTVPFESLPFGMVITRLS